MEQEVVSKVADHGARITGLEKWRPGVDEKLWQLQARLPNWAVLLISLLTAALGMLAGLAAVKGG